MPVRESMRRAARSTVVLAGACARGADANKATPMHATMKRDDDGVMTTTPPVRGDLAGILRIRASDA